MPKYLATGIIHKAGKVYRDGAEVELTEEQAAALKDHVAPMELADPDKPLEDMTKKELVAVAQAANVEGYSRMTKDQLYSVLTGIPVPEQAVTDDESAGDRSVSGEDAE